MPFLVIFIVIPLLELMVFAAIGDEIGLFNALFLALITAIIGGALVRKQGLETIVALQKASQAGKMPMSELFDGFCLVIAGATLITPGFITDTIGFLLLVPAIRGAIKSYIRDHTNIGVSGESFRDPGSNDTNIIDGEFIEIKDEDNQP